MKSDSVSCVPLPIATATNRYMESTSPLCSEPSRIQSRLSNVWIFFQSLTFRAKTSQSKPPVNSNFYFSTFCSDKNHWGIPMSSKEKKIAHIPESRALSFSVVTGRMRGTFKSLFLKEKTDSSRWYITTVTAKYHISFIFPVLFPRRSWFLLSLIPACSGYCLTAHFQHSVTQACLWMLKWFN